MTRVARAEIRKILFDLSRKIPLDWDNPIDEALDAIVKLVDTRVAYAISQGAHLGEILELVGLEIAPKERHPSPRRTPDDPLPRPRDPLDAGLQGG